MVEVLISKNQAADIILLYRKYPIQRKSNILRNLELADLYNLKTTNANVLSKFTLSGFLKGWVKDDKSLSSTVVWALLVQVRLSWLEQ